MIFNESSGISLNIKIVGGTSTPSNPKDGTIWVNTSTDIHAWDFSVKEAVKRSNNKNLIVNPYGSAKEQTINGVKFTPYVGGTIGVSGTASAQATFYLNDEKNAIQLSAGTYTFSGAVSGATASTYVVGLKYSYDNFETESYSTTHEEKTITLTKPAKVVVYLQVKSGVTASGNFKPQIEAGSAATAFIKGDATGQIWIKTGSASNVEFNALKKNTVKVYPIQAYQWDGTNWTSKVAKSYLNGKWNEWITWLYKNGDEKNELTGGWISTAMRNDGNYWASDSVTVTKDASSIKMISDKKAGGKLVHTKNKVDLSGANELFFTCETTVTGDCRVIVGAWSALGTTDAYVAPVAAVTNPKGTVKIDVSQLSGEYYIGVFGSSYSTGTLTATLTDVHY